MPEWFSVKDRLPSRPDWVLCYGDGAITTYAYVVGRGFRDWEKKQSPGLNIYMITHWMSLPDPPEEVKDE